MRAATAMLSCFVAGLLLAGLISLAFGGPSVGKFVVSGLVAAVFFFTGIHAAGVLLMDQARNVESRSLTDAVVYGMLCVPKTIVLIIALVLASVGVYIVLAALFFVCKIPGLGQVLFTLVFPLAVIVAGLTTAALMLGLQLALAAIWDGASISGAIASALTILRRRLVEAVLLSLVAGIISGVVFLFVAGVLLFGFWPALGLSVSILGISGLGDMGSVMSGMMYGGGGGYALAGALGSGILWALALTLAFQVALLGANLCYLRLSDGLDASGVEAAMKARLDEARRKAADMGQRAKEAAERARAQAGLAAAQRRAAQVAPAAPAAAVMLNTCPECRGAVTAADEFCGNCGFKLT